MKHLNLNDINPDNLRMYVEKPDKDFSEDRNYRVINNVLEENDKMQNQLSEKVKESAGERADILASFAKYKLDLGGEKKVEQYLGKSWMTKIYGERLIEKIRMQEIIEKQNKKDNNNIYGGNFYLK